MSQITINTTGQNFLVFIGEEWKKFGVYLQIIMNFQVRPVKSLTKSTKNVWAVRRFNAILL